MNTVTRERQNAWHAMFDTIETNEAEERARVSEMARNIEIGEQYFTFWTKGISGPFTYEGNQNCAFNSFIRGDVESLTLAQAAFDFMFQRWEMDEKRDFFGQVPEIFTEARIAEEIAATDDAEVVRMLEALRLNSAEIVRSLCVRV